MSHGGTELRIRASDLAAIFEVYLLAVALGALKTALDLTAPWFSGPATFWTYATTFIGSLALLSVLALAAVVLARPRGYEATTRTATPEDAAKAANPTAAAEEEMDEILSFLQRASGPSTDPRGGSETMAETVHLPSVQPRLQAAVARPVRARRTLVTLVGPSVTAAFFAALSAALLPGAEGYLQTSFALNAFVVLFFAYGWAGLLGYSLSSLFLAASEA